MKAFLRPHRFRHLYPVRFYTTKTQSGHLVLRIVAMQNVCEQRGRHRKRRMRGLFLGADPGDEVPTRRA